MIAVSVDCVREPVKPTDEPSQALVDAWMLLDIYFYFRDRLPEDPFFYDEPEALYMSVNEPYTVYYPHWFAEERIVPLFSSSVANLGIWPDSVMSGVLVRQVFEGSAAEAAGLLPHDTITHVNGASCVGLSLDSASELLSGRGGETLVLALRRPSGEATVNAVLTEYMAPTVLVDSIDTAVAYIWLKEFSDDTKHSAGSAGEFHEALERTAWAEYTILDLRDNGGGLLDQCLDISGEFVPVGTAVVEASERRPDSSVSRGRVRYFGRTVDTVWSTTEAGVAQQRRFHVLVNEWSASASEILVSCLRDYRSDDITIVGTTTYGKARGQYIIGYDFDTGEFFLADEGLARITFSRITPVYGAPYDSVGITPDVVIGEGQSALAVAMERIDQERSTTVAKSRLRAARLAAIERSRTALRRETWLPLCIGGRLRR